MEICKINLNPGLYVIATPIGNLEDITFRALKTLKSTDLILCENTMNSLKLLSAYGIKTKLGSYNDHSDHKTRTKIINLIKEGKSVALISDAGTPLISDPGYKLVSALRNENLYVTGCPGPSSLINALAISGAQTDRFAFEGFLPLKQKQRQEKLEKILSNQATTVIFDTGKKILETLKDLRDFFGNTEITILREMTKKFEEQISDSLNNLITKFEQEEPRGEIVIILPSQQNQTDMVKISQEISKLKNNPALSNKDILNMILFKYQNTSKTEVYNIIKNDRY
jgi:16S rRNA (cytidine1402-2'-O)-methyltransferase